MGRRDESLPVAWFASDYYQAQVGTSLSMHPWQHFQTVGWRLGLSPHPWFDVVHYLSRSGPLDGIDPVTHFVELGWKQGLDPHPLFDVSRYLAAVGDLEGVSDPLTHYLVAGASHSISPHPLVDLHYLRRRHRLSWSADPMTGLLARGMDGLHRCHPLFSEKRLRLRQRFLEGTQPEFWSKEERIRKWVDWNSRLSPSPLFDSDHYASRYPQAVSYPGGVWQHFVQVGQFGDYDPNPYFSSAYYRDRYADRLGERSPFLHYMTFERTLKFDPCEEFDVSHYVARHRDAFRRGTSLLENFLENDRYRGAEIRPNRIPDFLARQLNEARGLESLIKPTSRDLSRLPHVNRHRSVRGARVFRDLVDQLETGFSVLILVGGTEPAPALAEIVARLLSRRSWSDSLVLATDQTSDAWRQALPKQARITCFEAASLEPLDERMRMSLIQQLIEEDRPDFTVLADSSTAWDLVSVKGLGLSSVTRFWAIADPSCTDRNPLTLEPLGTARGAAWEHCEGVVVSQAHAAQWSDLPGVGPLSDSRRAALSTLVIESTLDELVPETLGLSASAAPPSADLANGAAS